MSTATSHIETEKRSAERSRSKLVPELRFKAHEDGWKILTLKNLIKDLQSGISVNSEDRPIVNDLEFGILKTSAVANGVFKKDENKKIVIEEITRAKLNPTQNEIIISRMNTPQLVGESGYIDQTYPNLFIPDRLWQTITYADKCYNRWLSYFLITDRVRYNLKSIATGTSGTMKNISKPNFLSIKVSCPSLPEQQKIASFLSTVNEKTQQLTKKKELLEQYKKGTMQQLFYGQLRFKDKNGNSYPDWEKRKITDLAKTNIGLVTSMTKHYVDNGVALIRNSDIKQNKIRKQALIYLDNSFAKLNKNRQLLVNDIVTVHTGDIGISAVIDNELNGCQGFATLNTRIKNQNEISSEYLCWFYNSQKSIKYALSMATGDGRSNYNLKDFNRAIIPVPNIEEQQKIAAFLSSIDIKIEAVNNQITQTQTFKKGLLQQMFV